MSPEQITDVLDKLVDAIADNTDALQCLSKGFIRCPICNRPRARIQAEVKGDKMRTVCPTCMADKLIQLGVDPQRAGYKDCALKPGFHVEEPI